ncbi:iron-sulfur cluster assembly scaffold protein [Pontiellaceae bacterium B12227]|nr:iron-sulfur cluster assembly scaffold protein [Pontiellaceae bacterium B12227]
MNYDLLAAAEGRPLNFGSMLHASAHARITGPCGDTLQFWLKIEGGIIRKVSFESDGCEDSVICCSIAAHMIEGLYLKEASALLPDDILAAAPQIREDHEHCAKLAVDTLHKALTAYAEQPPKVPLKQKLKQFIHHEKRFHGKSGHTPPARGGRHV